jgi:hypothetical protein
VLVIGELATAWLLVTTLFALGAHADVMAAEMGRATAGAASSTSDVVALLTVAAALALAVGLFRAGLDRPAGHSRFTPRSSAYGSFLAYAVAVLPQVRGAAACSHLVLMAQTMLLIVAAPALLMSTLARTSTAPVRPGSVRPGSSQRVLAPLAAVGYVAVLYLWHVPTVHETAMTRPGLDSLRIATSAIAGLLVWGLLLGHQRPAAARSRLVALIVIAIPSGVLGLGLIVATHPLFQMSGALPLGMSPVTDQRLAGVLMMIVDVLVLVPAAGYLQDGCIRSAAPDRLTLSSLP